MTDNQEDREKWRHKKQPEEQQPRWYHPMEFGKWRRKRFEKRFGKCYGDNFFERWPVDKFYTKPILDLLIIPEGYHGVKLNLGRTGKMIKEDADGNILPEDAPANSVARQYRDWPYGGLWKPGFHLMWSLFGLGQLAVVYTGPRQETISNLELTTGDLAPVGVDAVMFYRVQDPISAMTSGRGDFRKAVVETAKASVSDFVGDHDLEELLRLRGAKNNIAAQWNRENPAPEVLKEIGVKIDSLYLSEVRATPELQAAIAAKVALVQQAQGQLAAEQYRAQAKVMQARADEEASRFHETAGARYQDTPDAKDVLFAEAARQKDSNVRYDAHTGKIADAVKDGLSGIAKAVENIFKPKEPPRQI